MRISVILLTIALMPAMLNAELITLTSGEVLRAPVKSRTDSALTIEHPILGVLSIPNESIAQVAAEPQEPDPVEPTVEPGVVPEPAPAPPVQQGLFIGWKGQFEAGFSLSRGNSETADARVAFGAKKENQRHRWTTDASYNLSRDQDQTTKNEFTAGLLKDWLQIDSPWFYFAGVRYDYDEFEAWEQRASGIAGIGYQWIKTPKLDVLFRAGLGGTKEFGDEADDLRPEGLIGGELKWNINERQWIEATTYYLPDLGDWPQARIRSSLGWVIRIDGMDGLSLKFGLENEYETQTQDNSEHNDLKLFSALVFEF